MGPVTVTLTGGSRAAATGTGCWGGRLAVDSELTFDVQYVRGLPAAAARSLSPTTWMLSLNAAGVSLVKTEFAVGHRQHRRRPAVTERGLWQYRWDEVAWLRFDECHERGMPYATLVELGLGEATAVFGARVIDGQRRELIRQAVAAWPAAGTRVRVFAPLGLGRSSTVA
jgi:hypothetical protein